MKMNKFLISTAFAFILSLILISFTASAVSAQNASISTSCADIACGNSSNDTVSITGFTSQPVPPVANFSTDVTSGYSPLTVQFTDLSENATEWYWDFGDGEYSNEQNPVHTFSNNYCGYYPPGYNSYYFVTLTAINENGTSYKSKEITASCPSAEVSEPLAASFFSFPDEKDPLSVQFQDNSVYGLGVWYNWDFGDGTTSNEANPFHTYPSAGDYTVTLTVTGEWAQDKTSQVVSVRNLKSPVANFSASPICGKVPLTVKFTDKSTGSPAGWKWCFGDGTSSTDENPVHTFCKAGEYNVTLIANNTVGSDKVTKSEYIRVLK